MHTGRTDHGGSVSSAGPLRRTGDAALFLGAVLPQLLESTVLQHVDVIDLQPGLGRDLFHGPAFDVPPVDDARLALIQSELLREQSDAQALPSTERARYNENAISNAWN